MATFIRDILGVRFLISGGKELQFQPPRDYGLEWVEGTVMTLLGLAKLRWDICGVNIALPEGVKVISTEVI